nr:hypothetical protein BaRGS_027539 [Batillaria attramentaria]
MSVNVAGLCSVVVFYIVILVMGIIAARKTAKSGTKEDVILADRTGVVYAPKVRKAGYVTMFDPFQLKYGRKVGALLFLPQMLGDMFWAASILAALGNTVAVILDFDATWSTVISAAVVIVYTFLGGLYSVAYTDVIQFFFIAVGLFGDRQIITSPSHNLGKGIWGVLATLIACTANSVYGLFVLCSDLMYVILFPQFTLVLWFTQSNAYGCLAGYSVAFLLRVLGGEPLIGLPALLRFPLYDEVAGQLFPFRTFSMLCNCAVTIAVSLLTNAVFFRGWVPAKYDKLNCLRQRTIDMVDKRDLEPTATEMVVTAPVRGDSELARRTIRPGALLCEDGNDEKLT